MSPNTDTWTIRTRWHVASVSVLTGSHCTYALAFQEAFRFSFFFEGEGGGGGRKGGVRVTGVFSTSLF